MIKFHVTIPSISVKIAFTSDLDDDLEKLISHQQEEEVLGVLDI